MKNSQQSFMAPLKKRTAPDNSLNSFYLSHFKCKH